MHPSLIQYFIATFLVFFGGFGLAQPFGASNDFNAELGDLPFSGVITLDEYDWFSAGDKHLGVIQIDLATGEKKRLAQGKFPWRHETGKLIYAQGCGTYIHRIMLVDETGLPVQITPCSSDVENAGASDTDFEFSKLSPDQTKVAVEAKAYLDWDYGYQTLVFDVDHSLLASFDNLFAPTWLPDGRLLVANEGIYITDSNLENLARLDGGRLVGVVNNIDVSPSGDRLIFEFNQQIWHMNLDGSELKELIYGSAALKYPTWSPDGSTIAYLATPETDYYYPTLFFTNIETGESYTVDLSPILSSPSSSNTVNGPLSWR